MAMSFEQVAEMAQRRVADCPVIVLGSGATIPYGLPSMPQLSDGLLSRIIPEGTSDTEVWERFKQRLDATSDLERALQDVTLTESLLSQVIHATWDLVAEKDRMMCDAVLVDANYLPLTRLFRHLLRTAQASVEVITTNYDRMVEYAANAAEAACYTGFSPGIFGGFITDFASVRCNLRCPGTQGHVLLWKVHGSLDWFENPTRQAFAVHGAWKVPSSCRPLMVTPGLAKFRETHRDPFRTVMTQADLALEKAKGYLCIGYGFNDEHIQPKLLSRLSKNDVPIVVITKTLSQAGHDLLLAKPTKNFLILESRENGTMVYYPDCAAGTLLHDRQIWSLPSFLDMVVGGVGERR